MAATLTERSAVPFHLGLTEPIDETTADDYPAVEGAYDPVEQIWKLPTGTPLPGPEAGPNAFSFIATWCYFSFGVNILEVDDIVEDA